MAYAWYGYFAPSGFFAKLGRVTQDEGRNSDGIALGGGKFNGLQIGYKTDRFYAYISGSAAATAASDLAAVGTNASNSTNGLAATAAVQHLRQRSDGSLPVRLLLGTSRSSKNAQAMAGSSVANLANGVGAGCGNYEQYASTKT